MKRLQRLLVLSHELRVNLPKAGQPSREGLATRLHREVFIYVKKDPAHGAQMGTERRDLIDGDDP